LRFNIILFFLVISLHSFSQEGAFCVKAQKLLGTFSVYHYQPIIQNEKTSQEIIELFVKELDPNGFVLKASDCELLRKNGDKFLSDILTCNNSYVNGANKIYLRSLTVSDSILKNILSKKINLDIKDSISFNILNNTKKRYSGTIKEYAIRLEKYIKYLSFNLVSDGEDFEKISETEFKDKVLAASVKILNNYIKKTQNEINTHENFVSSSLLNAIALRHDPHSNYFTEEQNRAFNTSLSSQVETFGFSLDETDDGQIFISEIDPGGPAWLSNEINNDDIFLSAKIGNEILRTEDLSAYDIQEKINNTKFKTITINIRKQNHIFKSIQLIKQKINSAENNVKGYVLLEDRRKTGYISLPSFYTDMDEHDKPGCANDVAKEIIKLEKDSIQGLIIDLRNNGGGSMEEAMNLAGIFIDEGPLFIYKEKNKKPTLMKDINRGSIFKKPLIVIINEGSASASELFSNIVKDYNVGVIVGQKSYGKGTAQNILPLDTNLLYSKNKNAINSNADFLKITIAKFYRLNCSTHQASGVVPDVNFPSTLGYNYIAENKEFFYLTSDTVVKKVIFQANTAININELKNNSNARMSNSKSFKKYNHLSDSIGKYLNGDQKIGLSYSAFKNYKKQTESIYKIMKNMNVNDKSSLLCINNNFDLQLEQVNEQSKEFNSKILNSIQSDIFIIEANAILHNLINQQKK